MAIDENWGEVIRKCGFYQEPNDLQHTYLSTKVLDVESDGYGRISVVEPKTLFDSTFTHGKNELFWNEITDGGGSTTFLTNRALISLDTGTADGDRVVRRTKRYFRYQAGKYHLATMVAMFPEPKENVVCRIGLNDDRDGFFFQVDSTGMSVVRRSYVTGSAVDEIVAQDNWNVDKLDGTGKSKFNLDNTKHNVYAVRINWHGGGPCTLGVFSGGRFVPCHEFETGNTIADNITSKPFLPLTAEIINEGIAASGTSFVQGASSYLVYGAASREQDRIFSAGMETTTKQVGTSATAVMSLRPKLTFNGVRNRVIISPLSFALSSTKALFIEIFVGGTISGGSWSSVSSESAAEFNTGAITLTGGRRVFSDYVDASQGEKKLSALADIETDLFVTLSLDSATATPVTYVARTFTTTDDIAVMFNWTELL